MTEPREKQEGWVSCLSCGKTSKTFILLNDKGGMECKSICPKCSNEAHTQNLHGLWSFMRAAARDIAQIKLDMIDLQDTPEDR
jgi:succinyl-CoA synthetase beta subunit